MEMENVIIDEREFAPLIEELDQKRVNYPKYDAPVVVYGSSSIRLWENIHEDLGAEKLLNYGFGGSTMQACDYYFDYFFKGLTPSKVVLYAGDNDIGQNLSPEGIIFHANNLKRKIREKYGQIPVTFISIKPSPCRMDRVESIKKVNETIQATWTEENDYFIDIFNPMLNSGEPIETYFIEDMLHMKQNGYDIWAKVIKEFKDKSY